MKIAANLVFIICVLFSAVCIARAADGECLSLRGEKREIIDVRQILNSEQNVLECLALSLQKGKVSQARSILDMYGQQYSLGITKVIQRQLHRLELIEQDIVQGESNCVPVVKWGQNQTHLFVATKMSHRWDSPPCLNTKHQNAHIFNSTFQYINVCHVSHQKITFNLTLSLYSEVSEQISMVNEGVGTFSVIISKKSSEVWPFLVKEETIYQIWNEIAERYNPVHAQYNELLNNKLKQRKSKPVYYQNSTNGQRRAKNKVKESIQSSQIEQAAFQKVNQLENEEKSNVKIVAAVEDTQKQSVRTENQVIASEQKESIQGINQNIENSQ